MSKNKIDIGDNLMILLIVVVLVAGMVMGSVVKCKGQGQTDTMYCMPISQARRAAEYAVKKLEQDTIIREMRLDLVRKHLDLQDVEGRFAEYQERAERIQAGDRKEQNDLINANVRLAADNDKLTFVKIPLLGKARRKDVNLVMKVALFGAGVLVGK